MDGNNRIALKLKEGVGYNDYCAAWLKAFKDVEPQITTLVEKLRLAEIDPVMDEYWFKMRVFDQYLWAQ